MFPIKSGLWLVRWLHQDFLQLYMHCKIVCCKFLTRILIHSHSQCWIRPKYFSPRSLHISYWGMLLQLQLLIFLLFLTNPFVHVCERGYAKLLSMFVKQMVSLKTCCFCIKNSTKSNLFWRAGILPVSCGFGWPRYNFVVE